MIATTLNRRQEIEEKATLLFQERGYSATSMRHLALKLNIEAASLYSHIKSKEELLRGICFKMASLFFEAIEKVEQESKDSPAETVLRLSIVEHVKVITQDISASAVFLNEWRHLSAPYLEKFVLMRDQYEQKFMEILKRGSSGKEFIMMDEKLATQYILSSINWTHSWYKSSGRMNAEEIGHQLASFIINGLKNQNTELKN